MMHVVFLVDLPETKTEPYGSSYSTVFQDAKIGGCIQLR